MKRKQTEPLRPLTLGQLKTISARSAPGSFEHELLWEIRRLHVLLHHLDAQISSEHVNSNRYWVIRRALEEGLGRKPLPSSANVQAAETQPHKKLITPTLL